MSARLDAQGWIDVVDRDGAVSLYSEGPYVRFGFPCTLAVRRQGERYEVVFSDHGDGSTVTRPSRRTLDREGLHAYLSRFLEGGRPVEKL